MNRTKKPDFRRRWVSLVVGGWVGWLGGLALAGEVEFVSPRADAVVAGLCPIEVQGSLEPPPAFILLSVNRRLVQATNVWPCRYEWNTTEGPNGAYRLRVDVYNAAHQRVYSRELRVQVQNPEPLKPEPAPPPRVADSYGPPPAGLPATGRAAPPQTGPSERVPRTAPLAAPSPLPGGGWIMPPSASERTGREKAPAAAAPPLPSALRLRPPAARRGKRVTTPAAQGTADSSPSPPADLLKQPRWPCALMFVQGASVSIVTQAYVIGEKVFAPVRLIFEGIGAQVQWEAAERAIHVRHLGVEAVLIPDREEMFIDGHPVPLSAPVFMENGWAMMHVRMLEEILPVQVRWRQQPRRVDVTPLKEE